MNYPNISILFNRIFIFKHEPFKVWVLVIFCLLIWIFPNQLLNFSVVVIKSENWHKVINFVSFAQIARAISVFPQLSPNWQL